MSNYLPGLEGVPATESNISDIDGRKGILSYRGYSIADLVKHSTFEETAMLLLDGELPDADALKQFSEELTRNRPVKYQIREMMQAMPPSGHPMDMLQTAVASLGMFYPATDSLDLEESLDYVHAMSVKIIARIPTIVAMWESIRRGYDPYPPRQDLGFAANLLYMFSGKEPEPEMVKLMDACLILHAEHTINASTFAALVTGSTLASPYGVVAAAIGTLAGPLHGGANQRVVEMLENIESPEAAPDWLEKQIEDGQLIWGLGHREYKVKDPRATILQHLMSQMPGRQSGNSNRLYEIAMALEKVAEQRLASKGVFANVDFYSGILYSEMGIPPDQFTSIFAIARSAGWLAHWREQLQDNRIFRPTQIYSGYERRAYVGMDKR